MTDQAAFDRVVDAEMSRLLVAESHRLTGASIEVHETGTERTDVAP